MLKPLYSVVLEDDSIFSGGVLGEDTKWRAITQKIKRIFYNLPSGDQLCLSKYDKYYFMVESVQDIGKGNSPLRHEYVYLLGAKDNKVTCYKVNIKNGNVEHTIYNDDDSFIKGINKDGWR